MERFEIFLASSIVEFKETRNDLGDFVRRIDDILIDHDLMIDLFECEFNDDSISALTEGKQEEYNIVLRRSEAFVMLVGKKLRKIYLWRVRGGN